MWSLRKTEQSGYKLGQLSFPQHTHMQKAEDLYYFTLI